MSKPGSLLFGEIFLCSVCLFCLSTIDIANHVEVYFRSFSVTVTFSFDYVCLFSVLISSSKEMKLIQPSAVQGQQSKPELVSGVVEETVVPESMQIKFECSTVIGGDSAADDAVAVAAAGDSAAAADSRDDDDGLVMMGSEDHCRSAAASLAKKTPKTGGKSLRRATAISEKLDEVSVYFSKPRADSAENLMFIRESGGIGTNEDSGSLDLRKDCRSDVPSIPRRYVVVLSTEVTWEIIAVRLLKFSFVYQFFFVFLFYT